MPEREGENTQFQRATILDPVYEEPYTAHLEKKMLDGADGFLNFLKSNAQQNDKRTSEHACNQTP